MPDFVLSVNLKKKRDKEENSEEIFFFWNIVSGYNLRSDLQNYSEIEYPA